MYRLRHIGLSLILALSFATFPAAAAKKNVPLVEHPPIKLTAGLTPQQIQRAVAAAGARYTWQVVAEKPGEMQLELVRRKHVLRVGVFYDAEQLSLKYLSSENLAAEVIGGQQMIHPKYHQWTRNLLTEINVGLLRQ